MKVLKILGLLLLLVIAFFLIGGAIQPTHFEYTGTTSIDAPKKIIFEKINDLRTWEEWGPWKDLDSTIAMTFGDKTKGVGASYTWTAKDDKGGKMTITEATPYTSQKGKVEFADGYGGDSFFKLEDGPNGTTKTTWGYAWDVPYPFNAIAVFTGGKTKKDMDSMFTPGLANLKKMCEEANQGMYRGYRVKNMEYPGASYLMIRDKIKIAGIQQFYETNFGAIMGAMAAKGIEMAGFPCGVFYEWDEEKGMTDMAAAIPVGDKGASAAKGNIKLVEVPASKGLFIDYYGPYEGSGEAHLAMEEYGKDKGITFKTPVIEAYASDPSTEPDTARWLTKVYYFYDSPIAEDQ